MRTIFALCGVILLVGGFFIWRAMLSPVEFGIFTGAPKVAVADLIERPKEFLGKTVTVEGTISEQCKTMGCFFFFRAGGSALRVELQQIAMNAPMRQGHQARVEGQIVPHGEGYQLFGSAVEFK
ncbi:MAG: hypothetical protein ABIZ80_17745 [Bryobacteraceae bacterium]